MSHGSARVSLAGSRDLTGPALSPRLPKPPAWWRAQPCHVTITGPLRSLQDLGQASLFTPTGCYECLGVAIATASVAYRIYQTILQLFVYTSVYTVKL